MTHPRPWITFAALCLLAGMAGAADFPVKITAARIGLPPGGKNIERDEAGQALHVAKFAAWAPVFVEVEVSGSVNEPAELIIEASDPDEINTTLAVPLNLAGVTGKTALCQLGTIGYLRPAGVGEATILIRAKGGKPLCEPFRIRSLRPRDPLNYVVLSLGAPLAGFDLPRPTGEADQTSLRGGRVDLTAFANIVDLPDHWIGYDAADLVVLNTSPGSEELLQKLFGEGGGPSERAKRAALLEWVRRGGSLVVTVGANATLVSQLSALREVLPFDVTGSRVPGVLSLSWSTRTASRTSTMSKVLGQKGATFPVAAFASKPGRPARVLIPLPDAATPVKDIYAGQAAFGLGKVTIVGFDLDRAPFTEFSAKPEFWDWVLYEGGANRASAGGDAKPRPASATVSEEEDEAGIALRTHTDTFDGVPVVSFGWVALLIVGYILLIGPIEYFFLKRVLGRLELTWITFPIIVLTVSAAAYYSAYSLKGRELKINKVDVVDVDPTSGRVYGTTWFTIFSPRIDTYTIGVTPGDGWGEPQPGTAISWMGAPRGGRASLLRRKYSYHNDKDAVANGLEKVPVQVWGTKSFVANWSGRFDPMANNAPARSELLHPPGDPNGVIGSFTLNLSVPVLSDCVLFYAGQAYPLPGGTIRPGETIRPVWDKLVPAPQWLQKEGGLEDLLRRVPNFSERTGGVKAQPTAGSTAPSAAFGSLPPWAILFHEGTLSHGEGVIPRNASLRRLDQTWRLHTDHKTEAILVGRAIVPSGTDAEQALCGSDSPSRLWLRGLPGSGARTPVPGTARQETWVRVYLPVR